MSIPGNLIIFFATLLISFGFSVYYLYHEYHEKNLAFIIISACFLLLYGTMNTLNVLRGNIVFWTEVIRWPVLLVGLYTCAWTDHKEMKIPNLVLLIMLIIRVILCVVNVIEEPLLWMSFVIDPLIGGLIGLVIMGLCMLIKKGAGMGDLKMLCVMGIYLGVFSEYNLFEPMILMCLCIFFYAIPMAIMKKVKLTDKIPLAPFAFAGVLIYCLLKLF